jgi:hypothetical protein
MFEYVLSESAAGEMALSLPLLNFVPVCACLRFFTYDSQRHMQGELVFIYKL